MVLAEWCRRKSKGLALFRQPFKFDQVIVRLLQRYVDSDVHAWMATVAEVVAVVHVIHVNIVGLVPVRRPGFRPGINNPEPKTAVLEAGAAVDDDHGRAVNAEKVSTAKMLAEPVLWNAIAYVTSAVVPGAVFALPMPCTLTLPDIVGRRMRGFVPVIASVFVRLPVMRLMDVLPVRLLMLRRTRNPMVLGSGCLVVVRALRLSLMVIVSRAMSLRTTVMFILMVLRTVVVVVIVPVLCVRRSA